MLFLTYILENIGKTGSEPSLIKLQKREEDIKEERIKPLSYILDH